MLGSRQLTSRRGCLKCVARRKKCDEVQPICGHCRRLDLACVWRGHNNLLIHLLPGNKVLRAIQATLLVHSEQPSYVPIDVILPACPRQALSSGYTPLRSELEHKLMQSLSSFLSMLMIPQADKSIVDHSHVFAAALQRLWVRDALIAFIAFVMSPRLSDLRELAYQRYNTAVRHVQHEISGAIDNARQEELLIATLFLGLIEVNNPENVVFPLLHFEAVGHFLRSIAQHSPAVTTTKSSATFHRIALESYLYHVAILSLFYPQTNRYTELSPQVEQQLEFPLGRAGMYENTIIALDINIYRILLGLITLGRVQPSEEKYIEKIQESQTSLDTISLRANQEISNHDSLAAERLGFWRLTHVASETLYILLLKVRERSVLATDSRVRAHLAAANTGLKSYSASRAWKGNLVWILTILLCASYVTGDFEDVCQNINHFKSGIWGADLARLEAMVKVVSAKRERSLRLASETDGVVKSTDHDTLAVLLHPRGVLVDQ